MYSVSAMNACNINFDPSPDLSRNESNIRCMPIKKKKKKKENTTSFVCSDFESVFA